MTDLDLDKMQKEIEHEINSTQFELDMIGAEISKTDVDNLIKYNYLQLHLKWLKTAQRYIQTIKEENEDDK